MKIDRWISEKIFNWYKTVKPTLSSTEKEALEAGTVSEWEKSLFNGKPDWDLLSQVSKPVLSREEQDFIDGPVEELCQQINDWQITHVDTDMPPSMWEFIKKNGFWGFIIPKEYGGKEFSAYAHSEILCKLYGVSATVGTTVNVPNSLGPAELLLHYGTPEQKKYYLPRLARGDEIPCFALTSPEAGSDASSIKDTGVICRGLFNNKEIIGIKLNWNKRYITLAPVATVLGLAFKLSDPDKLLNNTSGEGITCALIPVNTPGITIGRRHLPLNTVFQNGPTQGHDVFIPLDWIIGGEKMAGQGWRMLVECLSAGRGISLPSTAIGGSQMAVFTTSAYARIREQFHLPIGKFEGVREVLARMAGNLYAMDAARMLTLALIDRGEKPSVLSAILKYHTTELARLVACDAMDIHGGKGICVGPHNYIAPFYQAIPIGITVEGANILTRSMIIFGQGAIRCHRFIMAELNAAQNNDLDQFHKALWGHITLVFKNMGRAFGLAFLPRSAERRVNRYSAAFGVISEILLLLLGAKLKRKEHLSARLGDIFSYLYIISASLKRYENDGKPLEDKCVLDWVCEQYFYKIQVSFSDILQNFPSRMAGFLVKWILFPLGQRCKKPSDKITERVSECLLSNNPTRDRLTAGMFKGNMMAKIQEALEKAGTDEGRRLAAEIAAVDDFTF